MAIPIEALAKQIAALTPETQAKIFARLAALKDLSGVQALAETYKSFLSPTIPDSGAEIVPFPRLTSPPAGTLSTSGETGSEPDRIREDAERYGVDNKIAAEEATCYEEIYAVFDGEALRPEGQVDLDRDMRYKVLVEKPLSSFPQIKNRAFRRIAARAVPMDINDFAEQHDHYIYGVPKK